MTGHDDAHVIDLCVCCAFMLVNGDESSCRDYYGHDHVSVTRHSERLTVVGDAVECARPWSWTCYGCGEDQGAYATLFYGHVLTF